MIASRTGIRLTPSWRAMSSWCTRSPCRSSPLKISERTWIATRSPLLGRSMSGTGAKPAASSSRFTTTCIRYADEGLGDCAAVPQGGDLIGAEPEVAEHRVGVDAGVRVRVTRLGNRAAEARSRRHLATTAGRGDEEVARHVVRVLVRLPEAVHRREAHVGAAELRFPLGARLRDHRRRDPFLHLGPAGAVVLFGQVVARDAELLQQLRVEVRLDGR